MKISNEEPLDTVTDVRAISVRQPWACAIARGHQPVINQDEPTTHRGPVLVYAGLRVDLTSVTSPLIRGVGWDPHDPLATMGAVIAMAELTSVCSAAADGGPCDCGPWAMPGHHHWRLDSPRPLPRPIVALGRPGLWEPPATLVADVHAMLAQTAPTLR